MPEHALPLVGALAGTGVVAGLLAGLIGVGGGIVIVPMLFFVFGALGVPPAAAMPIATGTSLATIIPTSISSIRAHRARGNVDGPLVRRWAPAMIAGVVAGSLTVTVIDGRVLAPLFGTVALAVAVRMLCFANAKPAAEALPGGPWQRVIAAAIGGLSVMIGIGGGTLGVPTLTAFNVPAHVAVGTAAAFGLVIALPGALVMLVAGQTPADAPAATFGLVNFVAVALIVPLSVTMAPVGAALAARIDAARLKQVFAVALAITGLRLASEVL